MNIPPEIVVLTNTRDLAADDIVRRLSEQHRVLRLNADRPIAEPRWSVSDRASTVGAVWWRQFERWPEGRMDGRAIDDLMVNRAQWRAWMAVLDNGHSRWINDLWNARRAENKIEQLRMANRCGFNVPDTIITNRSEDARAFAAIGAAVVKSLASAYFEFSGDGFMYTHNLDDALALSEDEWTAQPVIVQRRVMGDDARVIVFNGECFGATCSTTDIDWRVAGSGATWSKWEVPEPLADQCLTYLQSFGLRYGAFDFILNENQCWFLEANQAGEWVFLDRPLKLGIAQALTDYLARLAIGSAE